MKVVTSEGLTVGWACWAFSGFEYDGENVSAKVGQPVKAEDSAQEVGRGEAGKEKMMSRIEELEAITGASMGDWQERLWQERLTPPGSKYVILVAIPVLPAYQRQGVGSALIRWGTNIADEEGVYCWVFSSNQGWVAFQKLGFGEVGRLEVELDEFAEELRNQQRGWEVGNVCVSLYAARYETSIGRSIM